MGNGKGKSRRSSQGDTNDKPIRTEGDSPLQRKRVTRLTKGEKARLQEIQQSFQPRGADDMSEDEKRREFLEWQIEHGQRKWI